MYMPLTTIIPFDNCQLDRCHTRHFSALLVLNCLKQVCGVNGPTSTLGDFPFIHINGSNSSCSPFVVLVRSSLQNLEDLLSRNGPARVITEAAEDRYTITQP